MGTKKVIDHKNRELQNFAMLYESCSIITTVTLIRYVYNYMSGKVHAKYCFGTFRQYSCPSV